MHVSSLDLFIKTINVQNDTFFWRENISLNISAITQSTQSQYQYSTSPTVSSPAGYQTSSLDGCDLWPRRCVRSQRACPPWLLGWRSVWCGSGPEEQVCSRCLAHSCTGTWESMTESWIRIRVTWLAAQQDPVFFFFIYFILFYFFNQGTATTLYCYTGSAVWQYGSMGILGNTDNNTWRGALRCRQLHALDFVYSVFVCKADVAAQGQESSGIQTHYYRREDWH